MADVLVLTRRDGTTLDSFIGSPYLAVVFEDTFHHEPQSADDNTWMAFYSEHDRAPETKAEKMEWLKQFIASDVREYTPPEADPTAAVPNGTGPPPDSSLT